MKNGTWLGRCVVGCLVMCAAVVAGAGESGEMDPLLVLLLEQKVITMEQAEAVQQQYDAQQRGEIEPRDSEPAVEAKPAQPSWTDRITFKGDVRLRYEGFSRDGAYDDGRRDRFRTRIRAGLDAKVSDRMTFGLQLRNGDPDDPVSNNTSYDGSFQFKEFNLAQGYLDIRATDSLSFIAGKFDAGKRWRVSDMQWDDDVTVEGLMENYSIDLDHGVWAGLDLAGYQYILEEVKGGDDSYLFGAQVNSAFELGENSRFSAGAGFDHFENPQNIVDLTMSGRLGGNAVTNILDENGLLVSDFEILNLFVEYRYTANERWPFKINLFHYRNLGAAGAGEDQDSAWFARAQFGDYRKVGRVALRYSYYDSEPDALFYAFTQSDTGRGSDLRAHRFDLRIGMIAKSYFNLTWYNTEPSSYDDEAIDRWQLDYIVKF